MAERDDHQEQGREDAEVDPDTGVEDRRATDRGEQVTRSDDQERGDQQAARLRLQEPEERQVEQVERDVAAEDRVRDDGPGGTERNAMLPEQDRLPGAGDGAGDAERRQDDHDDDRDPPERDQVRHVDRGHGDGTAALAAPTAPRIPRPALARPVGIRRCLVQAIDPALDRAALPGRRRHEPAGEPEVAEEDRQGDDEAEQ